MASDVGKERWRRASGLEAGNSVGKRAGGLEAKFGAK